MRRKQLSDEGLTDDEWKNHSVIEEPIGSMLTAKVYDSAFRTGSNECVSILGKEGRRRGSHVQ